MGFKFYSPTGSNGAAATAANTGAYILNAPSPATATIDSAAGYGGFNGVTFVSSSANTNVMMRVLLDAANMSFEYRGPFRVDRTSDTAEMDIWHARTGTNAGTNGGFYVALSISEKIKVYNVDHSVNATVSTNSLAIGDYEIYIKGTVATSTTGSLQVTVYNKGSNTVIDTWSVTNWNLGTTAISGFDVGLNSATGSTSHTTHVMPIQTTSGTAIGLAAIANPSAAFSVSATASVASVNATASTIGTTGTTLTAYDVDWGDGSPHATTSTASHDYSTTTGNGTYTVAVKVTDSIGLTNTVTHPVTISAGSVNPTVISFTGSGYTASSGSTVSVLNDGDNTTMDTVTTSGVPWTANLSSTLTPGTGDALQVIVHHSIANATSGTFTIQLLEGATVRSSFTGVTLPIDVTTGTVNGYTVHNFPWSDVSAITWPSSTLSVKVTPTFS